MVGKQTTYLLSWNSKVSFNMISFHNLSHNTREITRNAALIIGMDGNQTTIKNPENMDAEPKKFAFDFSYWSHDGYQERADGYLEPQDPKFADQVPSCSLT